MTTDKSEQLRALDGALHQLADLRTPPKPKPASGVQSWGPAPVPKPPPEPRDRPILGLLVLVAILFGLWYLFVR